MAQPPQQRQSPRAPLHLRTTNSTDSNGAQTHPRRTSPKQEGNPRRSPRTPLHELPAAVNQKKRGTRVTDLETKLGHAKDELRKLKEQLASAEFAKRNAQHELEETKKMIPRSESGAGEKLEEAHHISVPTQEGDELPTDVPPPFVEDGESKAGSLLTPEEGDDGTHEVVVAITEEVKKQNDEDSNGQEPQQTVSPDEAQMVEIQEEAAMLQEAKLLVDTAVMDSCLAENANLKKQLAEAQTRTEMFQEAKLPLDTEVMENSLAENANLKKQLADAQAGMLQEAKLPVDTLVMERSLAENANLKKQLAQAQAEMLHEAMLPENTEVVEPSLAENVNLKRQLAEAKAKASAAREREEEIAMRLTLAGKELQEAKSTAGQLREQLQAAEVAKAALEAEMRTMRVQTEQWRKAAEAAAAVLSGPEARAPRVKEERRASMDENMRGAGYEVSGGGLSRLWSPLATVELEEGLGGGRRKGGGGGGIRVFGELWKRRGQQQRI